MTMRGVNLGGWLVLEKWMTPSLFAGTDAVDEWTFMQTDGAADKLDEHRKNFITEADFKWIVRSGLDAFRLPVGYWIIEPDGPYASGIEYVDWAYKMAEKYDLKILLDLHGAHGSQNGHDHSGRTGRADWFVDKSNRGKTTNILIILHERYKKSPSYYGIELLNEPKIGILQRKLRRFYRRSAHTLDGRARIVFHDGFTPRLMSGALGRNKRAVMDMHLYHMTSWLARLVSAERFVKMSSWWYEILLRTVTRKQPVVIGEWSVVLRGESLAGIDKKQADTLMQEFGQNQIVVYEKYAEAWFYWSYKTETPGLWNFRSLIESGFISINK